MSKERGFRKTFNFYVECQQNKNPFLRVTKKPVSSEENTCKDNNLVAKDHTSNEGGEVGASLRVTKNPVSSEENTCKDNNLVEMKHAYKEDGEVGASLRVTKKP
eukprot:658762-Ditylum_brightwellii.AAC.1